MMAAVRIWSSPAGVQQSSIFDLDIEYHLVLSDIWILIRQRRMAQRMNMDHSGNGQLRCVANHFK